MKREIDSKFKQLLSYLEQNEPSMAKTLKQNKDEMIKAVEADLYPERNKNKGGSSWI